MLPFCTLISPCPVTPLTAPSCPCRGGSRGAAGAWGGGSRGCLGGRQQESWGEPEPCQGILLPRVGGDNQGGDGAVQALHLPLKKEQRERVCEALGLDRVAHGGPHVPAGHSGGDCPFCRTMLRQGWLGSRPGAHPAAAADKPSVLAHLAVTRGRNVNSNGRR